MPLSGWTAKFHLSQEEQKVTRLPPDRLDIVEWSISGEMAEASL